MLTKETAREGLLEILKPGDTVYTLLRHVSRSGMSRSISMFAMIDGKPCEIDYSAAIVGGDKIDRNNGGIKIGGCGMDMGFALVYELSYRLFPDGFDCIGEHCPSNDHANGDRDYTPGHVRHTEGGYALKHRWL